VPFTIAQRVVGCLTGIATGDAIGKQSEGFSRDDIARWYPDGVRGFESPLGTVVPRYRGNRKHEWRVGETTDDTERTVAVARAIIAERCVSHVAVGRELLRCTKCVHPGLASLWEFHQAGDAARIAAAHDGCGGAVRVAPVGIFCGPGSLNDLVEGARAASISTHGGSLAIAGAAAIAAAVSVAVAGGGPRDAFEYAVEAAALAERRWPGGDAPRMAAAIRSVHDGLAGLAAVRAGDVAARCVPDHPLRIVPLALALAALTESAEDAILLAANIGGDSDSVASMAAGILGAMFPASVNQEWYGAVADVEGVDLVALAHELALVASTRKDRQP